ncbi:hypothetical protein CN533_25855 [Priestia megaterium]|uniref:hypothetical protein n=1 Tax=Priestia megaterium TaxID=1404 RepID=UPI000BF972EE|nr:hypothetical protein [Priestia megaterium]PET68585.1 hypothetical protein CN533_25855 [Priestia megaterium]PFK84474.1 hypothetical protein COJ19_21215 [Priestia megaterium]
MDQEYVEIQKNSLEIIYPAYIKKRLLSNLSERSLIINNKRMSNGGNNLLLPDVSYIEDINSKINHLFAHMNIKTLIDSIEELEFNKEYRHILWFKLQNLNLDRIIEKINQNENGVFSVYNSNFESDTVDENASVVTIKQLPSYIYIKFSYLLTPKTPTYFGRNIKYVVLARIDIENEVLEICFDKVKFDYRPSENFYSQIIDASLSRLTSMLELDIVNIDFKGLIYYIKENKEDVLIVSMKMRRNGTVAHLDSFENEEYIIPILGELKGFIDENATLFSSNDKCKEIENELMKFIGNIEVTSDLPNVKLRWQDARISLGADHNYHMKDYTLFMLYDELSTERRRIDYVREYFIKCYTEFREQIQSESLSEETN